jgi:hypothetical protein
MPSQGQYTQPYYGYGSGYYNGPYGYSPGSMYYADPLYYNRIAPRYTYYYPYPVIVRCPDKNSDGRCDKPVKDRDGDNDQGGHHVNDNDSKYRRDARGIVPQTRAPQATRSETVTRTATQPAAVQRTQVMQAQEPRVMRPAQQPRGSEDSAPPPRRADPPQQWPQQMQWQQQRR